MALPDVNTIREYYLSGKWNDRMLQVALVCKAITKDDVESIKAEKAAAAEKSTKKSSKKSKATT